MKMSAEVITKEAYTEQYEKNQYFKKKSHGR